MAKSKKDYAVVEVVRGLSTRQAGELHERFVKAKLDVAPEARGTGGITKGENIGHMLQGANKKAITDGNS